MSLSTSARVALAFATGLVLVLSAVMILLAGGNQTDRDYPYHSARFTELVADSFREGGTGTAKVFYDWMDRAYAKGKIHYPGKEKLPLEQLLDKKRHELAGITDAKRKTQAETNLGAWLHKMVKSVIPRFTLDRGFEFRFTVAYGERQCFLQSVLIAGMLQRAGVDAGVAMVYKNTRGDLSNNGHAVTIVKLPNGLDTIIDASDAAPFARHRGLFVRTGDYSYVDPVYARASDVITGYTLAANRSRLSTTRIKPLDVGFIRSQFWYYRGERAVGGLMAEHPTRAGLQASARALKISVRLCDRNPLAVYMLGRAYAALGDMTLARKQFARAGTLYARFGWTPPSIKDYALSAAH